MTRTKVGLIFDDGFAKSTLATAAIFEQYKLPAVFAVLADSSSFVPGCGDWAMWNDLQRRGHIIQPHGQTHAKLTDLPLSTAYRLVSELVDGGALERADSGGYCVGLRLWEIGSLAPTSAALPHVATSSSSGRCISIGVPMLPFAGGPAIT